MQRCGQHKQTTFTAAASTSSDGPNAPNTALKKRRGVQKKTPLGTRQDHVGAGTDPQKPLPSKTRKAARPIKRADADAMFLQLLPEEGIEQLQHQLKDEMSALVEHKGGKMMASSKKSAEAHVAAENSTTDATDNAIMQTPIT